MWINRLHKILSYNGKLSPFVCLSLLHVFLSLRISAAYRLEISTTSKSSTGTSGWSSPTSSAGPSRIDRWVAEAISLARGLDCESVNLMTASDCHKIQSREESEMNVYVAPLKFQDRTKYSLIVPDGGLRLSGEHDSVILIDPYPSANFGHLVLIYFINLGVGREECTEDNGVYLEQGECLQLAEKQRCRNRLRARSNHRQCDINFIPLVYKVGDDRKKQQLICRDDIRGFARCPEYRSDPGNYTLHCELQANTHRCNEPRRQQVRARCKFYEICDQAVLISGGWNRYTNVQRHADNVRAMYNMLRENGFKKSHIKTFFADSGDILDDIDKDGGGKHTYPATNKYGIRNHISTLCRTSDCVDSFFIYLNSPALTDGTSLLWDKDQNGLATTDEIYTTEELLEDLSECTAKQVLVVADQSFSGRLAEALQTSDSPHPKVAIFTSGSKHDYSWGSELTNEWSRANHTDYCVTTIYEGYEDRLTSSPLLSEEMTGFANATIFGAPCDRLDFYQRQDLKNAYMGCQNLPAWHWWGRHKRGGRK